MKIDKTKVIQLVGVAGAMLGFGATMLSDWSNNKKMEQLVEDKVKEILAKKLSEVK